MTAFLRRLAATCGLVMMALAATPAFAQEAAAAAKPATEDARLAAFFEEVFQRNLKDSPIFQAQLGMKGPDYGKWGDFSDKEANRQNELNKNDLVRLRSEFKYDALSSGMKVSYRIFELQQESAVAIFPWRFHNYAFSTTSNPMTQFATFMQNIHSVDNVSDAEAYISRLKLLEPAVKAGHRNDEHGCRSAASSRRHSRSTRCWPTAARSCRVRRSTTAARIRRCSPTSAARWKSSRSRMRRKSACSTRASPR